MSTVNETVDQAGQLSTDHSRAELQGDHSHGGVPEASRAERKTSFDLADFPMPTGREETWRFTPMDRIASLLSDTTGTDRPRVDVQAPDSVTIETVNREDSRLGTVGAPGDRASALAWAGMTEALIVTIPPAVHTERDVHITLTGEGGSGCGHIAIFAEAESESVVILDHRGSMDYLQNVEINVGEDAKLTVVSVQDWDSDAKHLSEHRARIERNGHLKHIVVTLGGDVVRLNPNVVFTAPGGETEGIGVYFADTGQHQEHRLFIDHAVDHCTSRVAYKGALQGKDAHTVWIGDVLIRAAAEGTDTYELNRNLVLTDGARADSVPNLEIETGEIEGAGHASTTGRFDDEQLFYLRSRGIPEAVARRLVVRGFFAELIMRIGVRDVEDRLMSSIDAELDRSLS